MRFLVGMLLVLFFATSAKAGLQYDLRLETSPGIFSAINSGGSLTVNLYLYESFTSPDTLRLGTDGLTSGSFVVNLAGNTATTFGTVAGSNNTGFGSVSTQQNSSLNWTVFNNVLGLDPAAVDSAPTATSARIHLGAFTLNLDGNTTTNEILSVAFTGNPGDIARGDGLFLDDTANLPAGVTVNLSSFTLTAVPEPTSIVAGSIMGLAGAWYARRRMKKLGATSEA